MTTEKENEMLAHLTPEERAAIEEDIGNENVSQHDVDEMKRAERLAQMDGETQVLDVSMAVDDKQEAVSAQDEQTDDEPVELLARRIEGPLRAPPIADVAAKIQELDDAENELVRKFEEGDITANEYRDSLKQLNDVRSDIKWQSQKAELASEMTETMQKQAWDDAVTDFMTTTGRQIANSMALSKAYDDVVRRVTSDPVNHRLSDKAQLEKAFNIFHAECEQNGVHFENPLKTRSRQPATQQQASRTRDDSGKFVPTLAKVPAADSEDIDGGKYAALDRLADTNYEAYEAQLAKMSPTELNAYMAAR